MFDCYIQCNLAAPDGIRGGIKNGNGNESDDDEINDSEDPDRIRYKDVLGTIGALGREAPDKILNLICESGSGNPGPRLGPANQVPVIRIVRESSSGEVDPRILSGNPVRESCPRNWVCNPVHESVFSNPGYSDTDSLTRIRCP